MTNIKCDDCDILMEQGHSVNWFQAYAYQTRWFAGTARLIPLLRTVRTKWREGMPIVIYRCPKCGLLKSYANGNVDS